MRLGHTALTRILSRASSSDSDLTKACCAALMMVEAMAFACGTLPVWPMMTMKRPPPCRRMCGATRAQAPTDRHLGLEMPQQGLGRDIVDAAGDMRAGIAHHDIDAAEAFDGVVDQRGDIGRLADIGDEALRLGRFQRRDRRVELARARGRRSRCGSLPRRDAARSRGRCRSCRR